MTGMIRTRVGPNGPDLANPEPAPESLVFPPGFLWGAATSAYQVEGGLTNNNWAVWERTRGPDGQPRISGGQRCGDAVGHWRRFGEDLKLMRELGLTAYRFSVEWSRVEPLPGYVDEAALLRYRRWCEQLRAAGITPLVSLHHFTEPLWVSEQGGFGNPATIPAFVRFAERVAAALGDVVEFWTTVNEPVGYAVQGWWRGEWPPGRTDPAETARVVRHLLLAHAGAYRALHRLAGDRPCRVGLAHNLVVFRAWRRRHPADRLAARLLDAAYNRAVLEALETGELRLRLPGLRYTAFVPGVAGTQDYLGLTHYYPMDVRFRPSRPERIDAGFAPGSPKNDLGWSLEPSSIVGVVDLLAGYGRPIVVLEHGTCDAENPDLRRRRLLGHTLAALRDAVDGGADDRGYVRWSLLDNFEWSYGFSARFGLFRVDHRTGARSATTSADYYRRIISAQPPGDNTWADRR